MLEKAGVAITPGLDFDSKRGKQTIRFSQISLEMQSKNKLRQGNDTCI